MLTQERLRHVLHYDESTGVFTWLVKRRGVVTAGTPAGSKRCDGYLSIKVDGVSHLAHRLAWFYVTGQWPSEQIDHFDGNRSNNAYANLREASAKQNRENTALYSRNSTGYRGVTQDKRTGRFVARIIHKSRGYHIGVFDSAAEAGEAARAARDRLFTHHKTPYAA